VPYGITAVIVFADSSIIPGTPLSEYPVIAFADDGDEVESLLLLHPFIKLCENIRMINNDMKILVARIKSPLHFK
jgi:hypothetical protein